MARDETGQPGRATGNWSLRDTLRDLPRHLLAPLPLAPLQPVLRRVVQHVAVSHPELFSRLGPHAGKRFLIDPVNLPFVLVLQPDAAQPRLTARRRHPAPLHDAAIAGSFGVLFAMIDGRLDGDALFFSRDLMVTGDTEAVVALRNALDDLDENVVDSLAAAFGPLSAPARLAATVLRSLTAEERNDR
jgi:predicted lipid carrier protein YhbT